MNTELREKERIAIERLKAFEPEDGYFLAYSGGKDSDCIKILAQLAGVKFEAVHNLTTVDAPETVRYMQTCIQGYDDFGFDRLVLIDAYLKCGEEHHEGK